MAFAVKGEAQAATGEYTKAITLFLRALKLGTDSEEARAAVLAQVGCFLTQQPRRRFCFCCQVESVMKGDVKVCVCMCACVCACVRVCVRACG